jgi:hypothetical protein
VDGESVIWQHLEIIEMVCPRWTFFLLACCWPVAEPLLKTAPLLLVRCWVLAGTLLKNGVFQQETSNQLARNQQGICIQAATDQQAPSKPEATWKQEN